MKVILTQDVNNLGKKGDIKEVAEGYARNFLLPKKLVKLATESAIREAEERKKKEVDEAQTEIGKMKQLARDLNGKEFVIKSKEKGGKLFGSVSKKDIAKILSENKFDLKEENIILDASLKKIGEFEIIVNLDQDVSAKIKIKIKSD